MKVEAYLDRIEDGKGTILVESIGKEFLIDASKLPAGSRDGVWLHAEVEGDQINVLSINKDKTADLEEKAKKQLNRIRNKSGASKFRRS